MHCRSCTRSTPFGVPVLSVCPALYPAAFCRVNCCWGTYTVRSDGCGHWGRSQAKKRGIIGPGFAYPIMENLSILSFGACIFLSLFTKFINRLPSVRPTDPTDWATLHTRPHSFYSSVQRSQPGLSHCPPVLPHPGTPPPVQPSTRPPTHPSFLSCSSPGLLLLGFCISPLRGVWPCPPSLPPSLPPEFQPSFQKWPFFVHVFRFVLWYGIFSYEL